MDNSKGLKLKAKLIHHLMGHNSAVYALSPYKGGESFLSAGGDGWIASWNYKESENGRLLAKTNSNLFALKYTPEHDLIISGDIVGDLHFVNISEEEKTKKISYHTKGIFGLYEVEGALLSLAGDGMMTRWTLDKINKTDSHQLTYHRLRGLVYLKKSKLIILGSSDKNIYVLDQETFTIKHVINLAHENSIFTLAATGDEKYLLSGSRDAILKVWDIKDDFKLLKSIPAHLFTINAIKFSPDNRIFATASRDKTIKLWDAHTFKLLKVIESIRDQGHVNSVNDLLWLSENRLISCSDDRSIKVWEVDY